MEILSVYDEAFRSYGRVVEGYPVAGILEALSKTPVTAGVVYVAKDESLHAAADAEKVGEGSSAECPSSWAGAMATTPG